LLKGGLITQNAINNLELFEELSDQLLNCFPGTCYQDDGSSDSMKKRLGKVISSKAKVLNVE
jgi:hypothetical protein